MLTVGPHRFPQIVDDGSDFISTHTTLIASLTSDIIKRPPPLARSLALARGAKTTENSPASQY